MALLMPHHSSQSGPFPFFSLPPELRFKILSLVLSLNRVIDLDPLNNFDAPQRLAVFLTSRRFHLEAAYVFYSSHTFRVFPTHWRFFSNTTKPLLSRLPVHYRRKLVTLELRLGPGWSNPPQSWLVSERLGLEDMVAVRKIKVFMECDPSHECFRGFRPARGFFTYFAGTLLEEMIRRLPTLQEVEFDAYKSVLYNGPLAMKLIGEAKRFSKRVSWGPDISSRSNPDAVDCHSERLVDC